MDADAEIKWEKDMLDRGIERYAAIRDRAVAGGRDAETSAGQRLLKAYIQQVADGIIAYFNSPDKRRVSADSKVLQNLDPFVLAYTAVKGMLTCVYQVDRAYTSVCGDIGARVEDEYHFRALEVHNKPYFDQAMRIVADKRSKNYGYLRNSILLSAQNNAEFKPDYWSHTQRCSIGLILSQLVLKHCDLFETRLGFAASKAFNRNEARFLVPTTECLEWVLAHDEAMAMLFPDRMPMLIPPDDWKSVTDGGYMTPELRATTPLIISSRMNPTKGLSKYGKHDMSQYMAGINRLQRTGWRINKRVLDVMHDVWYMNLGIGMPPSEPYTVPPCPLEPGAKPKDTDEEEAFKEWKAGARNVHAKEAERSALCMLVHRNMGMANKLKDLDVFYYVYRADFRGRAYAASTGISPQGPDQSKGMLEFSEAKELTEDGVQPFLIHGANKFGYDKVSYEDRVKWIEEHTADWLRVAADPIGNKDVWGTADKPYQFLAWCFEFAGYKMLGHKFRSRIPVAWDGTCNGLQHFSAMMRDAVGGKQVNLVPTDVPADIYQTVANIASMKLLELKDDPNEGGAINWLRLFRSLDPEKPWMPRKLSKKPVMTLPYGSTQNTCTDSIFSWYSETKTGFFGETGFRHAIYLSPILWSAIGDVVIQARTAMSWIQKTAGLVAKERGQVLYVTPLGFPVYQRAYMQETKTVQTQLNGRISITVQASTAEPDSRRIRQGASPNFVHSIDATHMLMVVNAAAKEDITSFAMIHDDFGTHACHAEALQRIIRNEFIKLHSKPLLHDLYEQLSAYAPDTTLPAAPPVGQLDLEAVRDSRYFFG